MKKWIRSLEAQCRAECKMDECGQSWIVGLEPKDLLPAVERIRKKGFFLEDVTGADFDEGFQLMYHFDHWDEPGRVTLKMRVDHDHPRAPSISSIFGGARWHERECFDFYGIEFEGHPNLIPILLPEESTVHPLVKDKEKRQSIYKVIPFCQMIDCGYLPEEDLEDLEKKQGS